MVLPGTIVRPCTAQKPVQGRCLMEADTDKLVRTKVGLRPARFCASPKDNTGSDQRTEGENAY